MKKSIAFLGALLFGSVTFGQVTKNDSIKKLGSRKVSADDINKLPVDLDSSEGTSNALTQKGREGKIMVVDEKQSSRISSKHIKGGVIQKGGSESLRTTEKHASDASAGTSSRIKGSVTQKGRSSAEVVTEKMGGNNSSKTTEKQHYTVKMTNANSANFKTSEGTSGEQVEVDSTKTQSAKSTDYFLKIGDIKGEK